MKKYRVVLIITVSLLLLMLSGCAQDTSTGDTSDSQESEPQLELTLEELSEYDGKDGAPAYIAVDGVIYDVSDSSRWKGGEHNGYSAGQDLTDIIKSKSPHGVSVLSRMPIVGQLVDE